MLELIMAAFFVALLLYWLVPELKISDPASSVIRAIVLAVAAIYISWKAWF